jgi:maltose/moltooligosaccharide transporter
LHASPDEIPILNLAGPLTGLLIQPIIGAMSDKTWQDGDAENPTFIGAIVCSILYFYFRLVYGWLLVYYGS